MSATKVTTDPQSQQDVKTENPGIVTSDSLAGESIRDNGSFAATSKARGYLDQPSSSTTTNTTDDSNTDRLDPARSRAERSDDDNSDDLLGGDGVTRSGSDNLERSSGAQPSKPRGENLQDGGEITGNEPNASFGTDIGGKNDPGRLALHKMEQDNAASSGTAAARTNKLDTDTPYDALGGSTSA